VHIIYHSDIAVFIGGMTEVSKGFYALAVSKMVVAADHKAVGGEKTGKIIVSANMLAHTVGYLEYAYRRYCIVMPNQRPYSVLAC